MRKAELPDNLRRQVEALEQRWNRPILLRSCRWPDPGLRGRVRRSHGAIVVEYRDDVAGYFWHFDIISELLRHVERGEFDVISRDDGPNSIAHKPHHDLDE